MRLLIAEDEKDLNQVITKTVSYTHLDVYKRQPYSCLKKKQHPSSATAIASVRCCLFYFIMPSASVPPEAGLPSP